MNFGRLESQHVRYEGVLDIGRTAARRVRRYHIAGYAGYGENPGGAVLLKGPDTNCFGKIQKTWDISSYSCHNLELSSMRTQEANKNPTKGVFQI